MALLLVRLRKQATEVVRTSERRCDGQVDRGTTMNECVHCRKLAMQGGCMNSSRRIRTAVA
jgi:hypothetical protein